MLILYINENWQNTVLLVTKSVGKCKDEFDQLRTDQKVMGEQKTLLSSQQTQIDNQRHEIETLKQMFNIFLKRY